MLYDNPKEFEIYLKFPSVFKMILNSILEASGVHESYIKSW